MHAKASGMNAAFFYLPGPVYHSRVQAPAEWTLKLPPLMALLAPLRRSSFWYGLKGLAGNGVSGFLGVTLKARFGFAGKSRGCLAVRSRRLE
jgi:hypothetical protein